MSDGERADRTARNAIVLATAEVVGKAGSIIYTVLAARSLDEAGYGAFAYAIATSLIAASVVSWGFDELLMQRTGGRPERVASATRQALTSKLVVGLPLFLAIAVALVPTRPSTEATVALLLVFAAALFDVVSDTGRAAAAMRERLTGVSVALVVNRVVTAGIAVAALLAGGGLLAISTAYLVGSVTGALATGFVVVRLGITLWPGGSLRTVASDLRTSWALGLTTVLGLVLFRVDALVVEAIAGDAAVGRYTVAYRIVENVLFVAWSLGRATFPVLTTADAATTARIVRRASGALAAVYVPFACVAVLRAADVLQLVFGGDYGRVSSPSLELLAATPLAFAVAYLLGSVLIARGDFNAVLAVYATAAVANVVANLLLVPVLSERGAAIATIGSYVGEAALAWWVVRRRVGTTAPLADWGPALVAGAAMASVLFVVDLRLLVELPLVGLVYVAAWLPLARRWTPGTFEQARRLLERVRPGTRDP